MICVHDVRILVGVNVKHALQMSDSVEVAAFGLLGRSYGPPILSVRGGVFANAQTGNLRFLVLI